MRIISIIIYSEQFKCQVNEFINQDYPDEIKKIIENNKKAAKEEENSAGRAATNHTKAPQIRQ
uniref:Uncharacterized protein n=1 Tax=Meloidogyne enterolobii TaxID=390850 RepID=A0A6V7V481_MELEN|nr:unnamed protein product [Meloidogyne enterolobii]